MKSLLKILNKIIDIVGWVSVIALLLMIVNVFVDVLVRYVLVEALKYFDAYLWYDQHLNWLGGIGMQELEWHWFSIMFLMGLGYTLRENGHVRVDVFYDNFPRKAQAWINILGAIIFTVPFCIIVIIGVPEDGELKGSLLFFLDSWESEESKGDPGSLPRLWPIKLVLPIAFTFLMLSAIAVIIKESLILADHPEEELK